jgi:hypothetical protein
VKATAVAFFAGCLSLFLFLFLFLAGPEARAASQKALERQITALDAAARAGYSAGDFEKMKRNLVKALAIGRGPVAQTPIMARVYLHLGVLNVEGLDKRAAGVRYFAQAIGISPDIQVGANMATKPVMSAFAEARQPKADQEKDQEKDRAKTKESAKDDNDDQDGQHGQNGQDDGADDEPPPPRRPARAATGSDRCHSDAELADLKKQARDEFDRLEKALSMSKDSLTKEAAQSEKYRKQSMELERELGEAKQRVAQLESEGSQKDKRSAAIAQREKKEREAREALAKEKADTDSLVLDTAQRIQQLEKETADKDKTIAAALEREKKEREAKEKLERELQTADARERERKTLAERARADRDKLEAGEPVPSRIPEPLHCAIPEEVQGGADLFVRCVTQPTVRAKTIVFYYRPANDAFYNAVVMDPTRRGWSRAVITANKVNGKLLQYYAEARDGRDAVAATNGHASSPNIVTIAPPGRR